MTAVVWVLFLWSYGKLVVVDNIATETNCRGVVAAYEQRLQHAIPPSDWACVAVRKTVLR